MRLTLTVTAGPERDQCFPLAEGQTLLVGRGREAAVKLSDSRVSRRHCEVSLAQDRATVRDVGSKSGTFVNARKISEHVLRPEDVLRVGDTELVLSPAAGPDQSTLTNAPVLAEVRPAAVGSELIGTTLHKYRLEREIAQGRTGTVFFARHVETDQPLAVKVFPWSGARNETDRRRFLRAMETMFPLRHQHIVCIVNAGMNERRVWVAMEYVEGESMAQVIRRAGVAGMLEWPYAYRVAVHVGRALEAAHEQQIVHRNITPHNILMRTADKVVKLGDLMLAKALAGPQAADVTRTGELVGELPYMPPERTGTGGTIDGRSDLYALGATCYALLAGRPPFEDPSLPQLLHQVRHEPPIPPRQFQLSINDLFEGVVLRLLAKSPDDRYQSATELLKDLERIGKYSGVPL